MNTRTFNTKKYVSIQYEDKQLLPTSDETLTYISQTLYGNITLQVAAFSKTDDDFLLQIVREIKDNHILNQTLTTLHRSYIEGHNGFFMKYPAENFNEDIFHKKENDFISYCLQMKPPKDRIYFLIEDSSSQNGYNDNIRICYEIINNRNRNFFEIGSFAPYNNGVKFFPFTKMATLFQDKFL